jgi:ubiquinone/menaquinone biosynthesis C-methylase UbiE
MQVTQCYKLAIRLQERASRQVTQCYKLTAAPRKLGGVAIHKAAAVGFSRAADAYERGRPEYPQEAIDFVAHEFSLGSSSAVLDLAAGTGKLTKALVSTGASVIAVEPLEPMRRKLTESLPSVRTLDGTAEAIPLPDEVVDAVTVGQAFHWFDGAAALREIHRVLRPGGGLALLWNTRDESVEWVARLSEVIEPYRSGAPGQRAGAWRSAFSETDLFTPLQERRFVHEQELDRQALVARVESISFISALPDDEREQVLRKTDELFEGEDRMVLPYRTHVHWALRR